MVFTGVNVNRFWKSDTDWFGEYIATYAQSTLGGADEATSHALARAQADTGRLIPGTPEFQAAFDQVIKDPDLSKGSQFKDESKYYHADANYNLSHLWDVVEVQVGGSFRKYSLNSSGTIYTDYDAPIEYSEFGIYTQLQKQFDLSEAVSLKLTGSARYDKSEYFDGFLSPRLSAGFTVHRDHNFRASIQTGFRNPSTQDLFIGLDSGRAILVGSAPDNLDRYSKEYTATNGTVYTQSGAAAYNNSYSANSVIAFSESGNPADLELGNSALVKPEKVTSAEIGYRGKLKRTVIDLSVYYNKYQDFISGENVIAPLYGEVGDNSASLVALSNGDYKVYQTYTNSQADVNSYGGSIGVSTKVFGDFDLGGSYTYTKQDFDTKRFPDFRTNFNTPEHKVKVSFGNTEVIKNLGFNLAWKWSDDYFWQASFGDGDIPAFHTIDAQLSFKVPTLKSAFKAGATNVLGDEYFTAIGAGNIGSMYYVSWTINNL